jgi:Diacylglycerol acyltransferase
VSKQSCSNILKSGPGSAIIIVVGGAAESLRAHPGTADLTLRRRSVLDSLFFDLFIEPFCIQIRVHKTRHPAWVCTKVDFPVPPLLTLSVIRADLVPVFSFGENDVYHFLGFPR